MANITGIANTLVLCPRSYDLWRPSTRILLYCEILKHCLHASTRQIYANIVKYHFIGHHWCMQKICACYIEYGALINASSWYVFMDEKKVDIIMKLHIIHGDFFRYDLNISRRDIKVVCMNDWRLYPSHDWRYRVSDVLIESIFTFADNIASEFSIN